MFVIFYIYINSQKLVESSKNMVIREAKTLFENIVTMRIWNASYDGVYVKPNSKIEPNPYLIDNIILSENNETLIKINPAWMTRQISEISNKRNHHYFKITSLNPINPNNAPDEFEKEALKFFETNRQEKYYYNFEDKLNFMGALTVEKGCLNCHNEQGYNIGDIRGGIRVSLSLDLYKKEIERIMERRWIIVIIITVISLIGFLLLYLFMRANKKYENDMLELNKTLEFKVKLRTKELELLNKTLKTQAITDSLTGIYNRNMFNTILVTRSEEAKKFDKPLSLIMFDIDYFKKINDNYGHQAGDVILKELTKLIGLHIRKDDVFVRWGGEEFMLLLNLKLEIALSVAENLRKVVENYDFSKVKKITCSFGVGEYKLSQTLDEFVRVTDDALYLAKSNGRNRVETL